MENVDIKNIEARFKELEYKAKKETLTEKERIEFKQCLRKILNFYHSK